MAKLVRRLESYRSDQQSIGGTARETLAKAIENQHFDSKALAWVRPMYRMAKDRPEAFSRSLSHLLSYITDLGLDDIADKHRGLDLEGTDDDAPQGQTDQPNPVVGGLKIVPKGDDESDVPAAPAAA